VPTVTFCSLLIGGVYLPMPLSLFLTRLIVARADHISGLAFFAATLMLSHGAVMSWEVNGSVGFTQQAILLCGRFVQGLGSGVLFQARFVLASLSTKNHHQDLQAKQMFASDLGLGIGALLPYVAAYIGGYSELPRTRPEFGTSVVLAFFSFMLLLWILLVFPRRLHRLPERVRFLESLGMVGEQEAQSSEAELRAWRRRLWTSGTVRVFVQSAAMMTLALWMRDAGLTGNFRQTKAIAVLCLLPVPFEALASGMCRPSWLPRPEERARIIAVGTVGVVVPIFAWTSYMGLSRSQGLNAAVAGLELAVLLIALAIAAPFNASRLYQMKDAERSVVVLEWLKAYIGRLIGPIFALAVQNWLGYDPLLAMLCVATVTVAMTA